MKFIYFINDLIDANEKRKVALQDLKELRKRWYGREKTVYLSTKTMIVTHETVIAEEDQVKDVLTKYTIIVAIELVGGAIGVAGAIKFFNWIIS